MPFLAKWGRRKSWCATQWGRPSARRDGLDGNGSPAACRAHAHKRQSRFSGVGPVSDSHFSTRPSWDRRETITAGVLDDVSERTNMDFAQCFAVVDMLLKAAVVSVEVVLPVPVGVAGVGDALFAVTRSVFGVGAGAGCG